LFPTSRQRHGSAAISPFPDYSAAHPVRRTAGGEPGFGLVFTVGQHLAMFDFVAMGGSWQGRYLADVDHLHEHFADPVVIKNGRYVTPLTASIGAKMLTSRVEGFH
jgi:hypothetical protein